MAVKKTNKDDTKNVEVKVPTEDIEVTSEPTPDVVEVKPTVVEEAKKADTTVRIRARKDHKCYIGGVCYYLEEGKCQNVPHNVKDILNRAGLLAPL